MLITKKKKYLLLASDSGALNTLLLLDLGSAFETVCHEILLSWVSAIGITGTAFEWFSSYLTGRQQFVIYQKHKSSTKSISSGVPQGSVLGRLLFTIYMLPIGQIIKCYGFNFHCYADDIQIYFSTSSTSVFPPPTLATCIKELKLWLEANYLKFNSGKPEVILIGSKAVVSKFSGQLMDLGGDLTMLSMTVRNLGDSTLSFNDHIGKVVKTAFFHLHNISRIRSSLSQQDGEAVIL